MCTQLHSSLQVPISFCGFVAILICSFAFALIPVRISAAGISPTVIEFSGYPGETLKSSVTIINTSASEQEYYLGIMGFEPNDETGSPKFFILDGSEQVARWIKFGSKSFVLPAMSKGEALFEVAIPDSTRAGGYYVAITVSQAPADVVASNGAVIEAKIASLVMLRVDGEVDERIALMDFKADGMSLGMPPASYRIRVQNQGNVHLEPTGSIIVKNWLGQTIEKFDANNGNGRVLPSSTRSYEVSTEKKELSWFGKAKFQLQHLVAGSTTATLNLSYGENGTIQSTINFWMFPWQLIVTVCIAACVLIAAARIANKIVRK